MRLTIRKSDWIDDWWLIERAEHDGRQWMEKVGPNAMGCGSCNFPLRTSSRFSDADVEGYGSEMLSLAAAITERSSFRAKRCAVAVKGQTAEFWSPRNSQEHGVVTIEEADELAALIVATVPQSTQTPEPK
ncbi:MAG TPA: hypothetical protein VE967_19515 [Gemmatimonadaceae bacterium]|nr:hypothetical protein [Gemmatimonadaceae bacterium]